MRKSVEALKRKEKATWRTERAEPLKLKAVAARPWLTRFEGETELLIGRRSWLNASGERAFTSRFGRSRSVVGGRLRGRLSVDFGQGWEFEKFDGISQRGFFIRIIGLRHGIGEF